MIPLVAVIKIGSGPGRRGFNLWLPLLLIWVVLLPFVLILLPIAMVAMAANRINPVAGLLAVIRVFTALPGLNVRVDAPDNSVLIAIY